MTTLFSHPRYTIDAPNYDSEVYTAKDFSPKQQIESTADTWGRCAVSNAKNSVVSVNGVPVFQQLERNGTTFKADPENIIQTLLTQNATPSDAIIQYIASYANLDGFMGNLELCLKRDVTQNNPDLLDKLDTISHYEFVTNSENNTVTYTERVNVSRQGEKIVTIQCSSMISVENGVVTHTIDDRNGGLTFTVHNTRDTDQLFGSQKSFITKIVSKIRELLSNLFSSNDAESQQHQCRPKF